MARCNCQRQLVIPDLRVRPRRSVKHLGSRSPGYVRCRRDGRICHLCISWGLGVRALPSPPPIPAATLYPRVCPGGVYLHGSGSLPILEVVRSRQLRPACFACGWRCWRRHRQHLGTGDGNQPINIHCICFLLFLLQICHLHLASNPQLMLLSFCCLTPRPLFPFIMWAAHQQPLADKAAATYCHVAQSCLNLQLPAVHAGGKVHTRHQATSTVELHIGGQQAIEVTHRCVPTQLAIRDGNFEGGNKQWVMQELLAEGLRAMGEVSCVWAGGGCGCTIGVEGCGIGTARRRWWRRRGCGNWWFGRDRAESCRRKGPVWRERVQIVNGGNCAGVMISKGRRFRPQGDLETGSEREFEG
ncbi:hypothetical protein Vafri_18395 [Volvox africanus]|uniref:Uncharacterized protein n=1 Tax=Volvox africanus TaxID=51714 RepID=A0A8J4BSE3_9CHLO|nr:hypothetical protein Vafri_18395 [Volvox africanus]